MRTALLLLATALMLSCGSDGDDGNDGGRTGEVPAISNLWSSRDSAQIGEGGGAVHVVMRFDYIDPDGDIDFARIRGRECGTGDWLTYDTDIEGVDGSTSGTIALAMPVDTVSCPPVVNDTIQVSVFDKQGNQSNILHGSFEFYE